MNNEPIDIRVYPLTDDDVPTYKVKVETSDGLTVHTVTLEEYYFDRIADGLLTPEAFIIESFHFMLEKESNTCILPDFEISDIARYYPNFEEDIQERIRHARRKM